MSEDVWKKLKELFKRWTGIVLPATMRVAALETITRLASRVGREPTAYLALVEEQMNERQVFIDQLGLGTTWFLRDEAGLRSLIDHLVRVSSPQEPVCLWSAGCSSGEEPYTLAIALVEAGRTPRILATDLNRLALKRAFEARYPRRSLTRLPRSWHKRYFEEADEGWFRVKDEVRRCVTFELHNLLTDTELPYGWSRFDAVVCRNALIYFEREQAIFIIEQLARLCRPGGYLLLGAVERPLFWMSELAGKRDLAELVQVPHSRMQTRPDLQPVPLSVVASRTPVPSPAERRSETSFSRPSTVPDASVRLSHLLERAEHAEQEGRLDDALALLDLAVERSPLMATAHLARGLLLKRAGRAHEAVESLRAARFLDDRGWLAPYQLALCLETTGEMEEAAEAYRHALGVLELGGPSGLHRQPIAVENLATTVAEICRNRLYAETERGG